MKIRDVVNYVETIEEPLIAKEFVSAGYGQNAGGYMSNVEGIHPSQKKHFLSYYKDKLDRYPSFASLWCPELILFIAEMLGLKREYVEEACEFLKQYEDEHEMHDKVKKATYLSFASTGENVLEEFKCKLKIYEINDILKRTATIEEAKELIGKL